MNGVREVAIAEVERELSRLWREVAQARPGEQKPAVVRTCTLNLVIAGCDGEQENLSAVLAQVTARHPARCIVASTEDASSAKDADMTVAATVAAEAKPHAWVNITCHPGGRGQPQVCSEQLVLKAPASALHELVVSIAGLLIADLPTFLWWRGRLPKTAAEQERFEHLADAADRVVLDSVDYEASDLGRVLQLVHAYPRLVFGDLNWARLTPWRSAVAQVFDPPAVLAQLPSLKKVRIFYAGTAIPARPSAAALLLAGWLRSRLQLSLPVEFAPGDSDAIELELPRNTFRIPRPPAPDEAEALSEELRVLGRDTVFDQALSAAAGSR